MFRNDLKSGLKSKRLVSLTLVFAMVISAFVFRVQPVYAVTSVVDKGTAEFETAYEGSLGDDERHVYTFSMDSSGKVGFNVTFDTRFCGFFVYDKSGNQLYASASRNEAGTYSDSLELLAGEYEARVYRDFNFLDGPVTNYSFILSYADVKETSSESYNKRNNEVTTATSYKIGDEIKAQLADNDDTDMYKFEMKKDGFVTLKLDSEIKNVNVEINSSFGDIKNSTGNIEVGYHEYKYFCAAGTYYFTCKTYSGNTGVYTFSISKEKFPTVGVKKVKSTYSGELTATIGRNEDVSGYEVQVATDSKFKKNIKSNTTTYSYDTVTISGLKTYSIYYVRVRTYVDAGNSKRYYSEWKVWGKKGKLKTVKIKK